MTTPGATASVGGLLRNPHIPLRPVLRAQYCFARYHCLGGLGLWDLDSDTYGSLMSTLASALAGDPAVCEAYETPECSNSGGCLTVLGPTCVTAGPRRGPHSYMPFL